VEAAASKNGRRLCRRETSPRSASRNRRLRRLPQKSGEPSPNKTRVCHRGRSATPPTILKPQGEPSMVSELIELNNCRILQQWCSLPCYLGTNSSNERTGSATGHTARPTVRTIRENPLRRCGNSAAFVRRSCDKIAKFHAIQLQSAARVLTLTFRFSIAGLWHCLRWAATSVISSKSRQP
jgi:hypothetical protein